MTPGSHASKVNRTLIRKVVPRPWFIKTANGGKRMFKTIVISDMFRFLDICYYCLRMFIKLP